MTSREEAAAGLNLFGTILARSGLKIRESKRPWPDRMATYVLIGNHDLNSGPGTDLVIPDEFLSDLPKAKEHKEAAEVYAQALSSRMKCGTEEQYFCRSGVPISLEVHWPINVGFTPDRRPVSWLTFKATNLLDDTVAHCSFQMAALSYPRTSEFSRLENLVNNTRQAIDDGAIRFLGTDVEIKEFQLIAQRPARQDTPATDQQIQKYLTDKAYYLGFIASHSPRPIWVPDPWDASYLRTTPGALMRAAHILQARQLLSISGEDASPSDKLLSEGPLELAGASRQRQRLSLATLPNKAAFESHIDDELKRGTELALIFIDLDHFKEVNDTQGHQAGDACLEKAIQAMGTAIGSKGTLYRWGGDEFAVCLPDFSTDEAAATAERIRRSIETSQAGGDIAVTASIGVCATDELTPGSAADFTNAADQAMYSSKKAGRNRVTAAYKAGFKLTSPKPQRRPL